MCILTPTVSALVNSNAFNKCYIAFHNVVHYSLLLKVLIMKLQRFQVVKAFSAHCSTPLKHQCFLQRTGSQDLVKLQYLSSKFSLLLECMHCSLVCVVPLKLLISLHGFLTALQISFWLSLPLRVTYRSHNSFPFYPLLPDRAVVWCCWPLLVTDWCSLHISASLGSCLQPTCFRSSFKNIVLVRILNLLSSSDRRKFPSTLRFSALHTGHS